MFLGFRPRRRDDLTARRVGEEVLVVDRELGKIHRFNRTASMIWSCCDGWQSVGGIAHRIARTFGEDLRLVESHVSAAVGQLAAAGLLETAPEAG